MDEPKEYITVGDVELFCMAKILGSRNYDVRRYGKNTLIAKRSVYEVTVKKVLPSRGNKE